MLPVFRQIYLVYETVLGGFYYDDFLTGAADFVNLVSLSKLVLFSYHSVPILLNYPIY